MNRAPRPEDIFILVVDDIPKNIQLVASVLSEVGYEIMPATSGEQALIRVKNRLPDLILLDLMMPGMDGFSVCRELKADEATRDIPVIFLTAATDTEQVIRGFSQGAVDYVTKPFQSAELLARVRTHLDLKHAREALEVANRELAAEQAKSEALLLNILPSATAERLLAGETNISDHVPMATVLFSDLVGFTALSSGLPAGEIVPMLNAIFSRFDSLCEQYGAEKIKTIGDGYMAAGGVPKPREDHAVLIAGLARAMHKAMAEFNAEHGLELQLRVGIHSGPVIAGVIGKKKFAYDLWGDTVNTASRMESNGKPGAVHVSAETQVLLEPHGFTFEAREPIQVKGKGLMHTFFMT